jgi:tetratricopeptide (TPR) repeat protein
MNYAKSNLFEKLGLIVFGIVLTFVLLEIGLRIAGWGLIALREIRNYASLRQGEYKILCLGESTTADSDGHDPYPRQLEDILNAQDLDLKCSVINKGCDGVNSETIVDHLTKYLDTYSPQVVTVMMGINDDRRDIRLLTDKEETVFMRILSCSRVVYLAKLIWLHVQSRAEASVEGDDDRAIAETMRTIDRLRRASDRSYRAGDAERTQAIQRELEAIYEDLPRRYPENDSFNMALAGYYESRGEFDKAEVMYKRAIKATPADFGAYQNLGELLIEQGRYDEAGEMFMKVIELKPDIELAYGYLARVRLMQGKVDQAMEAFDKADGIKKQIYNSRTTKNYSILKNEILKRGCKLIVIQYPVLSVEPLKEMVGEGHGVYFVDNERSFKAAIVRDSYETYFRDSFGGSFGHCTTKGNALLASNVAKVILKACFKRNLKIAG